jgi:hypothetical protein
MRILVVGNGFDIEHGLRTKYPQFMDFVRWLNAVDTEPEKYSLDDDDIATYKRLVADKPAIVTELKAYVSDNLWIEYFESIRESNKETWIDFESEIASVVKLFDKGRQDYLKKAVFYTDQEEPSKEFKRLYNILTGNNISSLSGVAFDNYRKKMLEDLRRLTRAMEIYMEYWVDSSPIKNMNPDITRIHPNKVISFNYTHTFDRVYRKNNYGTEYCYIHGEAKGTSLQENNMVLGIDDYIQSEPEDGFFLGFKKYYQRLDLNTDTSYKKWIEQILNKQDETSEIYIFGHSLDVTDREVFEPLLNISNAKTIVYCFDKDARSKLIANVIKLIGKDAAIQKINSGQIAFVLQAKSSTIENSELEINSDIHDLYRLGKLSFDEIDALLNKVKTKIDDENIGYFNDLKYIISVVDALASNNLYSLIDEAKILSIIQKMATLKTYDFLFDKDEWVDFYPNGENFTRPETDKVVSVINSQIYNNAAGVTNKYEELFNKSHLNPAEMKMENYLHVFEKAYKYFSTNRNFDEKAIAYLAYLFRGNCDEAKKALKTLEKQIRNGENYNSPYGEIFYSLMYEVIDEIDYENFLNTVDLPPEDYITT